MAKPTYELLAEAFRAEGVTTHFTLSGDGNMHWAVALEAMGVRTISVRHEHCACAMASSYALATGDVGVASVTCGPGLTQTMTALTTAVQAGIPLVVFAGESPVNASFYNQRVDQGPLVTACGAHYIAAYSMKRMQDYVREAFLIARTERRPVVIGIPYDLQKQPLELPAYVPSTAVIPRTGRGMADPAYIVEAVGMIAAARRVIVIGGRGAMRSEAGSECAVLADLCGGMLATTLPARGLFDDNPFSIGIAGGFAPQVARELFAEADLIVSVGASMTNHTVDGGRLFGSAKVIQIDRHPLGLKHGRKVADLYVEADAKAGLAAILDGLKAAGRAPSDWRTPELARRIAEEPADPTVFDIEPGALDPRDVVKALDGLLPKRWEVVNSSGHCSYFTAQMRGRKADNFHVIREFGAIGNGLSYAMGVAVARPGNDVVLFDGDGGLLMHAQELETIRRHGLKLLICVLNDGGFGSEFHKLRADGVSDDVSVFGRGDLGSMARGFGLRGSVVTRLDQFGPLLEEFMAGDTAMLLDIHVSDRVISPPMRRLIASH